MKDLKKRFQLKKGAMACFFIFLWAVIITFFAAVPMAATVTSGTQKFSLENGLTVILKEDHSAPVASIQVWVKTGSANETLEEAGITHLIEHMIFKGTPSRKTGEIARTIESAGGKINAYTSFDRTVYYVEIAGSCFNTGLDVLLDAVQHSLFDPDELAREKEVVLEEYRRSLDSPQRRLSRALMKLCYEEHPYGMPIIGNEPAIRSFDRDAILHYMDKWYTPDNITIVAVGDFDAACAFNTIKSLVKNFPKRGGNAHARSVEPEQTELREKVIAADVQQIYLDMAWHIPPLTHPDLPCLDMLSIILSHGKSSRLYNRLKRESNLVHSIDTGAYSLCDPGLFLVDAAISPEKLKNALKALGEEISRMATEPVDDHELSKARAIAEADFIFGMENMAGQARTLGFFQTMTGDVYNADQYLQRLKQVTADDIKHVAINYLRPENLSIGLLAPNESNITLSKQEVADLFPKIPGRTALKTAENPKLNMNASKVILSNGMRVIVKENHHLPVVSLSLALLGGSRFEASNQWGISAFTASMLTEGTKNMTASQIASTVESWAGVLDGFSGRNSFGVSASFLSKDLYPGLDLLADVALNPTFPKTEMEKTREDMLAGIKAKKDHPMPQLFDLFYKTLYKTHPYGHPLSGTEKTIQSIKRSDLVAWHKTLTVPSNIVLAVVGDVNKSRLIPYIEKLFQELAPSSRKLPDIQPEPPLNGLRTAQIQRDGAQSHLVAGYLGSDLKSSENAPMEIITSALSGQGGRLFFELRDKASLAYSVTAFRRPGLETGVFGAYLACDPRKLSVAKKAVLQELDKLREKGLTQEELQASKKYILGNLQIDHQTNKSQAMQMSLDELYGLGFDHLERQHIPDIKAVTLKDIKRTAHKIIDPERFVFVTVAAGGKSD